MRIPRCRTTLYSDLLGLGNICILVDHHPAALALGINTSDLDTPGAYIHTYVVS